MGRRLRRCGDAGRRGRVRGGGAAARRVRLRPGTPLRTGLRVVAVALPLALVIGCAGSNARESTREPARGRVHVVAPGENLYRIGLRYGVSADALRRANGIRDVSAIAVGTRLRVPRATALPAAPSRAARPKVRRHQGLELSWPTEGRVTSRFGRRRGQPHEGVDVGGPRGRAVRAAAPGRVIRAGWLGDYGRIIVIKHTGSYTTVYAHLSRGYVRGGQFVERGDRIGAMGATGNARGVHLHFEVRRGDAPVDPLRYLP